MRIGIDFDRVLFDTDKFNEYLKQAVEGLEHVDEEPYDQHGCYSPEMHAELCGIPVERIYRAMEDLERFLYDDVSELESIEHEKIIITRGKPGFQEAKMDGSGVLKFVDGFIVIEEGSKDIDGIEFLVDDRKVEIEDAGVPGFVFDREKHTMTDVIDAVNEFDE
ncbi:MAG: hypothetical protein ABEJ99_04070 [Candidatus Nanohaloarchaea archaeon]